MHKNIIDIIKQYVSSDPVDVFGLASEMGIDVAERSLPDNTSGSLKKTDHGYTITINQSHSENRKRFTVAHEIAHFILHDNLIGGGIYDNMAYRSDDGRSNPNIKQYHETEANKFAASILMPTKLIQELQSQGVGSSRELAGRLGVSEQAMRIRMGLAA